MKASVAASFALLLSVAACGGAKKDADNPENSENAADGGGGDDSAVADIPAPAESSTPSGKPVAGDDGAKKASPCGGFDIADLASMLSQSECEVGPGPDDQATDVSNVLEVKVVPDSPRIAPGSTSTITVTYKNKGTKELALDFIVDPEPRFDFEVYTLKGVRVDKPKGNEPALPPEVANAPQPEPKSRASSSPSRARRG